MMIMWRRAKHSKVRINNPLIDTKPGMSAGVSII